MNLLHLEQFYEVAKIGNISLAARKLRISQPALSKSIRLLEETLGNRLFERTKRGVSLTPEGKTALEHASRIFSEAHHLENQLKSRQSVLSGEWSLGASDNLAIHLLPRLLTEMHRAHPALRIQIFSGPSTNIKDELYADRCEAALFFTPPRSSEPFDFREIASTEFWIVLGKKSPWAKKKKKWTVADLKEESIPRIESRHKDYAGGFPAHFHSRKAGLSESPLFQANLHEVKKRLVLEGAGYSFLVKHSVSEEVAKGDLIRIPTREPMKAPIYWVSRRGRIPSRASLDFITRFESAHPAHSRNLLTRPA